MVRDSPVGKEQAWGPRRRYFTDLSVTTQIRGYRQTVVVKRRDRESGGDSRGGDSVYVSGKS